MKWVSTNPSLGAGKSSLAIGSPPAHPLIAPAGGRRLRADEDRGGTG
jgi:hypothetical protein